MLLLGGAADPHRHRSVTATGTVTSLDELCVDTIRTLSMDAVQKANSGHPGTPMALAARMLAARFNREGHEVIDHRTFVIASDGDIQEGICSEASSLAGHLGLGRLTVFYDDNKIQLAGPVSEAFSEDVGERYEAYG